MLADYRVRPGSLSGGKLGAAADTFALYRHAGLSRTSAGWHLAQNLARAAAKRL